MINNKHISARPQAGGTASNARGMTIIELMLTLSVVGILMAIALPSFTSVIQNNRIRGQSSDLMANLAIARAEAAKRGIRVTICTSTTYNSTPPSCTGGGATAWNLGYIIFSDVSGNGAFNAGAGDTLIAVAEPLSGGNTLTSANFTGTGAATSGFVATDDTFQFRPSGATDLPSGTVPSFKLCDSRTGLFGRQITISVTGRFASAAVTCP
jgi:type IV fimbrial biogenesis protein FimT